MHHMDPPESSRLGDMRVNDVIKEIGCMKLSDVIEGIGRPILPGSEMGDVLKRIEDMPRDHVSIPIADLEKETAFNGIMFERSATDYQLPRVPGWCALDPGAYTPKYICIGPYHRGENGNPLRQERLKMYFVHLLSLYCRPDIKEWLDELKGELTTRSRRFYLETFNDINDDEWAMMLLLDGCFCIMHLLNCSIDGPDFTTTWAKRQVKIDLALVENQLPFFILEKIFHLFQDCKDDYIEFADISTALRGMAVYLWVSRKPEDFEAMKTVKNTEKEVRHLVHLIHMAHCDLIDTEPEPKSGVSGPLFKIKKSICCYLEKFCFCLFNIKKCICSACPIKLMQALTCLCNCDEMAEEAAEAAAAAGENEMTASPMLQENIASAMKLHRLGIQFVATKRDVGSQYDVRISSNDPDKLMIPPVEISLTLAPLLHNLIAFEQQYGVMQTEQESEDQQTEQQGKLIIHDHFTRYAFLMYNLINSGEDISLLQERGILLNNYGTDEQVISYFKNLLLWNSRLPVHFRTNLDQRNCPLRCKGKASPTTPAIVRAMNDLENRSKHREYRDWAEAKKYCNSPVQVLLLVTSILVFTSTILQTVASLNGR